MERAFSWRTWPADCSALKPWEKVDAAVGGYLLSLPTAAPSQGRFREGAAAPCWGAAAAAAAEEEDSGRAGSARRALDGRPWLRTCSMQARPREVHLKCAVVLVMGVGLGIFRLSVQSRAQPAFTADAYTDAVGRGVLSRRHNP